MQSFDARMGSLTVEQTSASQSVTANSMHRSALPQQVLRCKAVVLPQQVLRCKSGPLA
jgi:hypothetical protein